MPQISTFMGLQTSLRGLLAQQRSLDVTSHNIANANTLGYTRQEAVLTPSRSHEVAAGALVTGAGALLGQGVEVESYRRLRDGFLDLQYRAQRMTLAERETTADLLGRAEEALGATDAGGIHDLLQGFWDSWQALAKNQDQGAKEGVVGKGSALAAELRALDGRLAGLQGLAAQEYASIAGPDGEVASAARDLAELNARIKGELLGGRQPNELLDKRDLVLDRLAEHGQVSTSDPDGDGALDVRFGDAAVKLVDGATGDVTWPQAMAAPGGRLGALLGAQATLAGYRTRLDGVAGGLIAGVNAIHSSPPFFSGTSAADIDVAVTGATMKAGTGTDGGSNDIALAVGALRNGAIDDGYAALVRQVGLDSAEAQRGRDTSAALVMAIDDRRQSVAGVSMDEEMTNLIRFQRGYQASARAMSTLDDMLDTLINRTGRVGL
jgi:flagellar hook-associated protein 1 FlgK